ncbi:hypothetical protein N7456_002371 [Penicillium angulare]|uniref:Enoyl reductase (ER) domain-containing protein n=1 Tax=Penicillium angulare TaxID=116970 RepID=A0A9W9KQ52_9EURO|nr:hypothetical protein N7456_002371 [Penicillium angulare]
MAIKKIPSSHTAMVYDNPGQISIKRVNISTPQPEYGQVLVRLTHVGVCHSDHGIMTNAWARYPRPTPVNQIGGHEGVGHVVQLGHGIKKGQLSLKVGDRVGIKFVHDICRLCAACLSGAESCCAEMEISGYFTPGCFQEYCVAPADYVTRIPDEVTSSLAAPLLCAGLSAYSALKKSRATPGSWIVILGAGGGVGHLMCQIASRALGLRVIGVDVQEKGGLIKECGAEVFLALEQGDRMHAIYRQTEGLGAAAVLVCTGEDSAFTEAIEMLRFNGVAVVVGVQEGTERPISSACPNAFLFKQTSIVGSSVGTYRESVEVMELARRGILQPCVNLEPLENLQNVFERMEAGTLKGKVVLNIP